MIKNKPIVVFVGTYPPRECGIATFTQDLFRSSRKFLGPYISCKIAALNMSPLDHYIYPPEVEWEINQDNEKEYVDLAQKFNSNPLISGIIIEHEYGIYGANQGENILSLIENCRKPILATLHTVLPKPSIKMKNVTARIIRRANVIVVLTQSSRKILENLYPFSIGKVYVIPHGIHQTAFSLTENAKKKLKLVNSTVLSTFGLLSRGKGIEYIIRALPEVVKKYPSVLYLIIGRTHPAVRHREGESYRLKLSKLVTELGLENHVKFYDHYLNLADLLEFLKATDIYISTSINPDQAVSGTLSYALGAGRAVISTNFTQAKEIVTPELGRLVPIKDSPAVTIAILDLLSNKNRLLKMHRSAYDATRSMLWSHVAEEYSHLLTQVVLPPINLRHLRLMTDDFGLFQFAKIDVPDHSSGYTLDDNARALIVCSHLAREPHQTKGLNLLTSIYLDFIETCQQTDGTFQNYIGYADKKPTPQNSREDLTDAASRAMWALSQVMANNLLPLEIRTKAQKIFLRALPHVTNFEHLRPKALMIKSLEAALKIVPKYKQEFRKLIKHMADSLILALKTNSDGSWHWFESQLSYNNALLPESLLIAGTLLEDNEYTQLGVSSMRFLTDQTFSAQTNIYLPIGHANWYKKNGTRSYFDQQPEDPASMILALATFYTITGHDSYKNLANKCFSWFLGNNSLNLSLYNYETGGCYDGLHPDRVNTNQGAESLVSYLLSRLIIAEINLK
jgi:glycosyltransferase involved in cell wall biosynthesis